MLYDGTLSVRYDQNIKSISLDTDSNIVPKFLYLFVLIKGNAALQLLLHFFQDFFHPKYFLPEAKK